MTTPPLTLDFSFPRKIVVEVNAEGTTGDVAPRCELQFATNRDNPRQWQGILTVHLESKDGTPAQVKGCVEYVGVFTVAESYPAEKMSKLVAITCPSILYSGIRELVALLTGRGPHRLVILPTVSFQDAVVENPVPATDPKLATPAPAAPATSGKIRAKVRIRPRKQAS